MEQFLSHHLSDLYILTLKHFADDANDIIHTLNFALVGNVQYMICVVIQNN